MILTIESNLRINLNSSADGRNSYLWQDFSITEKLQQKKEKMEHSVAVTVVEVFNGICIILA